MMYLFPVGQCRDDFEGLGQFPAAVSTQDSFDFFVHVDDTFIHFLHVNTGVVWEQRKTVSGTFWEH